MLGRPFLKLALSVITSGLAGSGCAQVAHGRPFVLNPSHGLATDCHDMESTRAGHGYWLFAADGGVFPFGDAPGYGQLARVHI
ncbi:MAG TPA: hypothetical protein VHJ99_08670 [Candidatus Dormibacteraeota bacterium]|nr:hypothetical protein [Candidatus Dormibacteraeota bacterium]